MKTELGSSDSLNRSNSLHGLNRPDKVDDANQVQTKSPVNDIACEIVCYDEQKITILKDVIDDSEVQDMAKMFKALSDPTRMKMAAYLDQGEELCVCDVAILTGQSIATTSHHLRLMKSLGIAKSRKEGKNVFYSLTDHHIRTLIRMTQEHLREEDCHDGDCD